MSAVSSCGASQPCESQSEPQKLRPSDLDRLKGDDKPSGSRNIDDIVDISGRDDSRVSAAANSDFGTSFEGLAPGRRVDIAA
jgi:hypothetical protein